MDAARLAIGLLVGLVALGTTVQGPGHNQQAAAATHITTSDRPADEPVPEPAAPTTSRSAALEAARADLAGVRAALKEARADADTTESALTSASHAFEEAEAARQQALDTANLAQEAMTRASVRLGDLMAASTESAATVARAAHRVQGAQPGSPTHRAAFTAWQMAAVADRAAHARQAIAEDVGAGLFSALQAAEATLADAEIALGEAMTVRTQSEGAAVEASTLVTTLKAEKDSRAAAVEALARELADAHAAAAATASRVAERLAELDSQGGGPR